MSEKKAEAPAEGDAAPKSKKKLIMFIGIGVVVLAIIAAGAAFMLMGKKSADDEEGGDEEHAEESDHKKGKGKDKEGKDGHAALPTFYKFDKPFTVRLAATPEGAGEGYLQLEVQLKLLDAHGVDAIKAAEPELKHKLTLLLLAKTTTGLSTAKGVEELAWEIRDVANHTLHPPKKKKKGDAAEEHHAPAGPDVDDDAAVQAVLFTTFIIQ
jgi:flagellar protein FliL